MLNAENVDQIFSEPPTLEERITSIELRLSELERKKSEPAPFQLLGGEMYQTNDRVQLVHVSYLDKAEARIAELEAELELEKAKNSSGISPIKLEPLAFYPL